VRDLLAAVVMILALAGRRIDGNDAEEERFPLRNVERVGLAVKEVLLQNGVTALVSSAACGADLLGLSEAGKLGIRRRVVLPFSRERFRAESVTDRPGNWGPLYDLIVDQVEAMGDLVSQKAQPRADPFEATNHEILNEALALGAGSREQVAAALVWDGMRSGEQDYTAAFADEARRRGLRILEVITQ
jgi:hypothetical protein